MKDKKREEELKNEIRKCLDKHDLDHVIFENQLITKHKDGGTEVEYGPVFTMTIKMRGNSQ